MKQKELQDYLRGQYKGGILQHTRGSVPDDDDNSDGDRDYGRHRDHDRDRDHDREHSPKGTRSSKGSFRQEGRSTRVDGNSNRIGNDISGSVKDRNADNRSGKQDRRDRGDDDDSSSRKWDDRKSSKSSPKGRQMEGGREDYNADSDPGDPPRDGGFDRGSSEYSKKNGRSKGNESRGGSNRHQDKEGRWVSDAEYVELTTLCDRLMNQQDRLQEEIQHQAELIKVSVQNDKSLIDRPIYMTTSAPLFQASLCAFNTVSFPLSFIGSAA